MGRKNLVKQVMNFIISILFGLALLSFLLLNIAHFCSVLKAQWSWDGKIQDKLLKIEPEFQNRIYRRNDFINIYGAALNAMQQKLVGKFDFVKDDHDIIQRFSTDVDYTPFLESMLDLDRYAEDEGTALVYMALPDKAKYLQLTDEYVFDGQQSKNVYNLLPTDIDCIDLGKLIEENADAPSYNEFYFKTDVHCSTYGEFWMLKELIYHLEAACQITFPNKEQILNLDNYKIASYEFLGNTARSAGKYFVGTDQFEIYKPKFETSLILNNPSASETKNGDFENVMLNGYEDEKYISEYTYWVTNFGRFTSPHYEYINRNAPEGAPNILLISDSVFMRGFSYLALACQKVTVLDPRYFDGMEYLAAELATDHYDAIVVVGTSVNFYNTHFDSANNLDDYQAVTMISQEEYGEWIANQGVCLDTCNDIRLEGRTTIPIDTSVSSIEFYGWAADFCSDKPFWNLYLQVGDILLKCDYHLDRTSVVDHFEKQSLLKTGFHVAFPVEYLQDGIVTEVSFIGVSAGGEYIYKPVTYNLSYT